MHNLLGVIHTLLLPQLSHSDVLVTSKVLLLPSLCPSVLLYLILPFTHKLIGGGDSSLTWVVKEVMDVVAEEGAGQGYGEGRTGVYWVG